MRVKLRFAILALLGFAVASPAFAQSPALIVEKKTFEMPAYTTVAGGTIKNVKIGWQSAGTLNADKSNAILITHSDLVFYAPYVEQAAKTMSAEAGQINGPNGHLNGLLAIGQAGEKISAFLGRQ